MGLAATLALSVATVPSHAEGFYRLESAVTLPGPVSGWDYLTFDPSRSYLFINRRDEGVTVFDTDAGKIIGRIENSEGANATTLVPEFDRGYTTNEDGTTTIFALSSLKTIGRLKLGDDADAGFYEPATKQVMFTMGDSKKLAFVDAKSGKILATMPMESAKLEASASDGDGNFFTAERDRNAVARVDAKLHKMTAEWKTEGCEQPTGLALDRTDHRIFVGCRGSKPVLAVLDSDNGRVVATMEIGRGNDGVAYDPETRRIYTSNGIDGNLVIFAETGPDDYKLVEATTTRPMARTLALDPKHKIVFTIAAEGVVDPAKTVNRAASAFYPNAYSANTLTLLTYAAGPATN